MAEVDTIVVFDKDGVAREVPTLLSVEAYIAATNALLTTQAGYLDGLETAIAATNSLLTTQAGYLDGIEAKLDTQITALQLIDNLAGALNAQGALRIQPEKADGTDVDPLLPGTGVMAAAIAVTLATDDTVAIAIRDAVRGLVDDAAFGVASSYVKPMGFLADESSTDSVDEGDAGAARITLDRKQIVTIQPHTAGGLSLFRSLDLDETEEDIKTSAGCLYKLRITNFATTTRYVKLYNAAAAAVTVGTTTPVDTIVVPPGSSTNPTVLTESFGGIGLNFDTAICAAATTALADNDTGAPGANEVVVSAYYK